LAVPDS